MKTIDLTKIGKEVPLNDGSRIVLLDLLAAPASVPDEDVSRNVYKLASTGRVEWQIDVESGVYSRAPFTGIYWGENGQFMAYRWDGTEYAVNLDTGKARPHLLAK
jgi:hypothetical protein